MSETEKYIRRVEAAIDEELAKLPPNVDPRSTFRVDLKAQKIVEERLPSGWNYQLLEAIGQPLRISITEIEPEAAAQIGLEE